jgi:hypothetical protein
MTLAQFANIVNTLEDLVIFTKALARDNAQKWRAIMEENICFLKKNNTWIHIVKAFSKP